MAADDGAVAEATAPDLTELPADQKVEAAKSEVEQSNHKVEFKIGEGEALKVQLPPDLPASVALRLPVLRDDDGVKALELLEVLLSPENYDSVLRKVDADGFKLRVSPEGGFDIDEKVLSAIGTLINDALASYGLTTGESQASQT